MSNHSNSIFADKGFSFDEILRGGKLGGKSAVASYLDVRVKQLTRMMESGNYTTTDRVRLILSIHAMTEARKVALNLYA